MNHSIIKDLNWRKTAKQHDKAKRIPEEDLAIFFEALRLSASSINSQPWRFVVIESDEARARFSQTFEHKFQFNQKHAFDASQIILFAYNPHYNRDNYTEVVDKMVEDGRVKPEDREGAFGGFVFAELNTDEMGDTSCWTKAQLYLALGNALHTLARLKIDATPLEGIDTKRVNNAFKKELNGYQCDVALAIGYSDAEQDFNAKLPKSRRSMESILVRV